MHSSNARQLRLSGAMRGAVITYGIAAYGLFMVWAGAAPVPRESPFAALARMVAFGLALQGLFLLVRWLVKRYERHHRLEGEVMPLVLCIAELFVDAASVLLFALATFRGILSTAMTM